MIILLITLISLISVYATRLLLKKEMKIAGISVAIFYIYLVCWIYAIFIIDISDLGFRETETLLSILHGSNIYHSFVQITAKMAFIPLPLLQVIVGVAVLIMVSSVAVILHGVFSISKEIIRWVKKTHTIKGVHLDEKVKITYGSIQNVSIIRLHCRANC